MTRQFGAADGRVELAFRSELREIAAEVVERRGLDCFHFGWACGAAQHQVADFPVASPFRMRNARRGRRLE
jgi:hypothetical protein